MNYETSIEFTGARQFLELLMKCEAVASRIEATFERISRLASNIQMPGGGGRGGSGGGGGRGSGGGRADGSVNVSIGRIGGSGGEGPPSGPSGPVTPLPGGSPHLPGATWPYGANASEWFDGGGAKPPPPPALPSGAPIDAFGKFLPTLASILAGLTIAIALFRTAVMIAKFDDDRSAYIREQARGGYYGGGTPHETAQQAALGGFMGMSSSQIGQFAEQFGARLQQGGFGSAFMRANGVTDIGMYTIDKSANLLKAVDLLTHIKSNTEALVVARTLGLEPFLALRDTDQLYRERLMKSMQPLSDSDKREANDYTAQKQSLQNRLDASQNWMFTHVFGPMGRYFAGTVENALYPKSPLDWLGNATSGGLYGQVKDWIQSQVGGTGLDNNRQKALDENTEAIRNHTRALKDGTDWSGGSIGSRRFGATPKGWKYNQFENALQGQALLLGAFSV
jgi:hypothetical protein